MNSSPWHALSTNLPDLALAAALAWGAGLRLYLVVFLLGLAGRLEWLALPGHLQLLSNPMILGVAAFMAILEMFADKLPWLDSVWDALHTFIRIPAGAALAAGVFGGGDAAGTLAAALLGGSLTATTHFAKASARAVVNTSPEPVSNIAVSSTEDGMVVGGLWLAWAHPLAFLALLALFLAAAGIVVRLTWRGLRRILRPRVPDG